MPTPTKFDALLQLHFLKQCTLEALVDSFSSHAKFEALSRRNLLKTLKGLVSDGLAGRENGVYRLVYGDKTKRLLAFLLWCRKDSLDFNRLLKPKISTMLEKLAGRAESGISDTGTSKNTAFRYFRLLEAAGFLRIVKKKPLRAIFNVNDRTLHYPLAQDTEARGLKRLESVCQEQINALDGLKTPHSPEFLEKLIRLHVYASTVTEGNTASESDVEKIVNNLPTALTPKETIEVKNTKAAVDFLLKEKTAELSCDYIKKLHALVMNGLTETAGRFETSATKRIIGSKLALPTSPDSIQFSIDSMVGFYNRNRGAVSPYVLAGIIHFWFVTVHPFIDGNGRVARLIHSKILVDNGLPLFVFDPDKKNRYFDALEEGRNTSIESFLEFALSEHYNAIKESAKASSSS